MAHAPSLEMQQRPLGCGMVVTLSTRNPRESRPNEDAVTACDVGVDSGIVAIADGAGGQPMPAAASRVAVEAIHEAARRAVDGAQLRTSIMDAFERANAAVIDLAAGASPSSGGPLRGPALSSGGPLRGPALSSGGPLRGASTTLVAAEIVGDIVRSYHAGDSLMVVVGSRGRVRVRTVAHGVSRQPSPTSFVSPGGARDTEDEGDPSALGVASNLLGMPDMRIEVGPRLALQRRDTLLLASDGLFDNLSMEEIVDHIRRGPLDEAAAALVQHALRRMVDACEGEPSKPDDVSVALFRLDN